MTQSIKLKPLNNDDYEFRLVTYDDLLCGCVYQKLYYNKTWSHFKYFKGHYYLTQNTDRLSELVELISLVEKNMLRTPTLKSWINKIVYNTKLDTKGIVCDVLKWNKITNTFDVEPDQLRVWRLEDKFIPSWTNISDYTLLHESSPLNEIVFDYDKYLENKNKSKNMSAARKLKENQTIKEIKEVNVNLLEFAKMTSKEIFDTIDYWIFRLQSAKSQEEKDLFQKQIAKNEALLIKKTELAQIVYGAEELTNFEVVEDVKIIDPTQKEIPFVETKELVLIPDAKSDLGNIIAKLAKEYSTSTSGLSMESLTKKLVDKLNQAKITGKTEGELRAMVNMVIDKSKRQLPSPDAKTYEKTKDSLTTKPTIKDVRDTVIDMFGNSITEDNIKKYLSESLLASKYQPKPGKKTHDWTSKEIDNFIKDIKNNWLPDTVQSKEDKETPFVEDAEVIEDTSDNESKIKDWIITTVKENKLPGFQVIKEIKKRYNSIGHNTNLQSAKDILVTLATEHNKAFLKTLKVKHKVDVEKIDKQLNDVYDKKEEVVGETQSVDTLNKYLSYVEDLINIFGNNAENAKKQADTTTAYFFKDRPQYSNTAYFKFHDWVRSYVENDQLFNKEFYLPVVKDFIEKQDFPEYVKNYVPKNSSVEEKKEVKTEPVNKDHIYVHFKVSEKNPELWKKVKDITKMSKLVVHVKDLTANNQWDDALSICLELIVDKKQIKGVSWDKIRVLTWFSKNILGSNNTITEQKTTTGTLTELEKKILNDQKDLTSPINSKGEPAATVTDPAQTVGMEEPVTVAKEKNQVPISSDNTDNDINYNGLLTVEDEASLKDELKALRKIKSSKVIGSKAYRRNILDTLQKNNSSYVKRLMKMKPNKLHHRINNLEN